MKLKNFKKEVVIKVDYSDLESLIEEIYGVEYEIMPMEEVGSSQYAATYDINVKKENIQDYEKENLENFKNGKPEQYILRTIMKDMCNNGHLEEGEYIISVNW